MIKINVIPESFGPFSLRHPERSTMEYGFHYEAKMKLPFDEEERYVRVWLPGTYDFSDPKKYPVLYMADGQNMVDRYLTRYGDWHLDRVVRDLMQQGYPEPILVGIDCPKDPLRRMNELNPPYPIRKKILKRGDGPNAPIGDRFIDYIVDELKPLIDNTFSTDPRKEATGIGGASMGGIMAFYGFLAYPGTFGFSLCFSSPFFFYKKKDLKRILKEHNPSPDTHGRIYLYVGGREFEHIFTKPVIYMHKLLLKYGFGHGTMELLVNKDAIHHEECWYQVSAVALQFWLSNL